LFRTGVKSLASLLMKGFAVKPTLLFSLLLLGLAPAAPGAAQWTPATMTRTHDPVQVPGSLLERLTGAPLDSMRLFAWHEGAMTQMPFQFDERLPNGNFIFHLGEKVNAELANNTLDPQDFLVFRVCDTGDKAPQSLWPSPEGIEIELTDPLSGGRSYCYLIKFPRSPPPLLEAGTVFLEHWDPWKDPELPFIVKGFSYRIEGMVNQVHGRYYKTAVNKNFKMPEAAGGMNVNVLDGQRMRSFCELFFGKIRIGADETNMIGGIDSLRHGCVRGFGRQWMTVALPLGLEGPRIYSDVFTYDRVIVSPMQLNIPFNPGHILTRAGIEFGYDFNSRARGMRFFSPSCLEGATIDGLMTEKEKAISDEWVSWYLVTGPQASLIFRVNIEESLMEQTTNRLTYIDDLGRAFPPEEEPGSMGYARTTIEMKSVKPGKYDFSIEWYFPPHMYRDGSYDKDTLQEFLNIKDAPLVIRAGGRQAENKAVNPPPLVVK